MSKDIFNGNIKKEYIGYVKFSLIFGAAIFSFTFLFFLLLGLLDDTMEEAAKITMLVLAFASLLAAILCPTISIFAIRNYHKHPKLAKSMIKPFVFQDFETDLVWCIAQSSSKKVTKNSLPILICSIYLDICLLLKIQKRYLKQLTTIWKGEWNATI